MIVFVAWIYVVLMMALAEALSSQGTVLGAVFTFLLYGVLPLSIVMYVMGSPLRRRARRAAESAAAAAQDANQDAAALPASAAATDSAAAPDGGREPPGDPVAPERKVP